MPETSFRTRTAQRVAPAHRSRRKSHRAVPAAGLTLALALPLAVLAGGPARAAVPAAATLTPAVAARLAGRVPTPVLHWSTCRKTAQCATTRLPLNYADPRGAQVTLALLRIPAKDPSERLGTIFVNPGGPGDSARDFAYSAAQPPALPKRILDRFDIVGVDPRGVGGSTPIDCFTSPTQRTRTEAPFAATPFPATAAQQQAWIRAGQALGRDCSTTGRPIATAMSSTDDALDLDVLRRAVGDRKLTYLGDSYGSFLGLVYANLFPSHVRALVIDGIVAPQAMVGTPSSAKVPVFDRIGAGAASWRVLTKLLTLCQQAGQARCPFATAHTATRYARLAASLRNRPLHLAAPGVKTSTFGYADLVADTEHWMHAPAGYQGLFPELTDLARLAAPGGGGGRHDKLVRALAKVRRALRPGPQPANQLEAQSGVECADGLSAASATAWPAAAAKADRQSPYFGAYYAWLSVQCAADTWTVRDPGVYRGPFSRRTAAPVLVIGNWWDPATSYTNAVQVARMLPNSRLISSDSWGHTALLTSACVDNTTWSYLIHPQAPAPKVTHCRGAVQPFPSTPSRR